MAYTIKVQLTGGEVVEARGAMVMIGGCGLDGDEEVQLVFSADGVLVCRVDASGEILSVSEREPESLVGG
jgi:hypothetical protein